MKTQLRQLTIATRGAFADSGQELSIVRFTQNAYVPYLSPQRLCNGATAHLLGVEVTREWKGRSAMDGDRASG